MPTYPVYGGWVISTIADRIEVTADKSPCAHRLLPPQRTGGDAETLTLHGWYGCSGDVPLPQLETSYDGDESMNILPTYQEVLFLIRVK